MSKKETNRNPILTLVVIVVIVIAGLFAFKGPLSNIGQSLTGDVVNVAAFPNAQAEAKELNEIDNQLTQKAQDILNDLSGIHNKDCDELRRLLAEFEALLQQLRSLSNRITNSNLNPQEKNGLKTGAGAIKAKATYKPPRNGRPQLNDNIALVIKLLKDLIAEKCNDPDSAAAFGGGSSMEYQQTIIEIREHLQQQAALDSKIPELMNKLRNMEEEINREISTKPRALTPQDNFIKGSTTNTSIKEENKTEIENPR
jgi:hypothetical protein